MKHRVSELCTDPAAVREGGLVAVVVAGTAVVAEIVAASAAQDAAVAGGVAVVALWVFQAATRTNSRLLHRSLSFHL